MKLRQKVEPRFRKIIPSKKGKIIYAGKHAYIKDYIKYLPKKTQPKRALVSYITQPIIEDLQGIHTIQFSNNGMARSIVKVINQLGYIVDVINWDDNDFKVSKNYDLIMIHGGKNLDKLLKCAKPNTTLILYTTGSYWKWHNSQEKKRFEEFYNRHHKRLKYDRFISSSEEKASIKADGIICLGNDKLKQTYRKFPNVTNINNASYPARKHYIYKSHKKTRNSFLFFAGPGNIHKGLDLLIDVFKETPNLHLHIGGTLDNDFEQFYKNELYNLPNIHTYGFLAPRGKEFYSVIHKCSFIIFPSCSEGSPGSVIEAMHHGLIPIVSKESHIDIDNTGQILTDTSVLSVKKVAIKMAKMNPRNLRQMSVNSWKLINDNYSIERFEKNFNHSLADIIHSRNVTQQYK